MRNARGPVDYTCPLIDEVIGEVDSAISTVSSLSDLTSARGVLEQIRSANDALRAWGAEEEDRADALQSEVDRLKDKLADAEARIDELEEKINDMEAV